MIKARIPEYHGEDWQDVDEKINYRAAETLAEEYWNEDPSDPNDFSVIVEVLADNDTIFKYEVSAYETVTFSANQITGWKKCNHKIARLKLEIDRL